MGTKLSFDVTVDVDGKLAAARVEELRKELAELTDADHVVKLGMSTAEFQVRVADVKAELREIATSKDIEIHARADATEALAELQIVKAEARDLDGKNVYLTVDDKGSAAESIGKFNALMAAGIALGPAIIPVAAAVAAAIAAIGTGAVIGVAALGVVKLGFTGVGDAVKELGSAQTGTAGKAAQSAATQVSSANSIANAQDTLRAAVANVRVAQESAASAVTSALQREHAAEVSLNDAQRTALRDQLALTQARMDAQRALLDMTFSVADNALAQRRAQIDLQAAQAAVAAIAPGDVRRPAADLSVDEAKQRVVELQEQGRRLAVDKATADKAGVEGSTRVVSAQDAVISANERVTAAQQSVADSARAVTTAQVTGARQVEQAQQSVVSAQRALQAAMAQQAAQAASAAVATTALATAMSKLSPEGQTFAHFVHDDLQPKVKELQGVAQAGLLPGVEQGLRNTFPLFPQLRGLVGDLSGTLGDMAAKAGAALTNPFWRGFIGFVRSEASPSLQIFGAVLGDLVTGGAAILVAFRPVWDQMGAGIKNWADRFAELSQGLSKNPEFQKFLTYVHDNGPMVARAIKDLAEMFVHIGQALGPVGADLLPVVDAVARFVNTLPPDVLGPLVIGIWSLSAGFQAMKGVTAMITAIKDATWLWTAAQWALDFAMDANPIGITIIVIGLLIGAILLAITHFDMFKQGFVDAWHGIEIGAKWLWHTVLEPFFGWMVDGIHWVGDTFTWLWRNSIGTAFNNIRDAVFWLWDNAIHPVFGWISDAVHWVGQAFENVSTWIRDTWGRIRDYARAPIQFVIDVVYNNGILPVWNGIADVFGLGHLNPVRMATGGVLPGYLPGRDTIPTMLSPGEGILVPEAVQALGPDFIHWANRKFSGGRVTGGPGYADGGIVGDITGLFTDPIGSIRKLFGRVVDSANHIPGAGLLHDAMARLPGKVIDAAVQKAKDFIASAGSIVTGGASSGTQQWAGVALQALGIAGQSPANLGRLLMQMGTESGGNPLAVNRTDINWINGVPSVGLLQVIRPTYEHYHHPAFNRPPFAYGVSEDPLSNILASIRYTLAAYGSLAAGWQGHGYANGGIVTRPTMGMLGESGPEVVLPVNRPHRAKSLLQQAGIGGSSVTVGPVYVSSDVDVDLLAHRLAFATSTAGF